MKEIEEGYIHRTVGYEVPDEELDLNYCKEAYTEDVEYALSNSLGFWLKIATAPVWASASTMSTPGITGSCGKCPAKKGSL